MAKHRQKKHKPVGHQCECSDPGCPVGHGSQVCLRPNAAKLHRIDMNDRSGTYMCMSCGEDALSTGLYE